MKKILLLLFVGVIFIFSSCEKDEDLPKEVADIKDEAQAPETASSMTPEEQKTVLENTGISMTQEMSSMATSKGAKTSVSFAYHLSYMSEENVNYKSMQKLKAFQVVDELNKSYDNNEKMIDLLTKGLVEDDPETVQELYDEVTGEYVWNSESQDWSVTENEKIIFRFPAEKGGTSNNAAFIVEPVEETTLDDYSLYNEEWMDVDEEYTGPVPTGINFYLKVDDNKVMEYKYSASFNSKGYPTEVSQSFMVSDYEYSWGFNNESQENISSSFSLTKGETTLIEFAAGLTGDLNQETIDNSMRYYTWDTETYRDSVISAEDTAKYERYWAEPDPSKMLNTGYAYMKFMDQVKAGGEVNIKALIEKEEEVYPLNHWDDESFDDKQATEDMAEAMNKHTNIHVINMEDNTWMAKSEFYAETETDTWGDYEEEYSYVAMKFEFSDDSEVEPEVYFGEGFDKFISKWEDALEEIEDAYSSYEEDL